MMINLETELVKPITKDEIRKATGIENIESLSIDETIEKILETGNENLITSTVSNHFDFSNIKKMQMDSFRYYNRDNDYKRNHSGAFLSKDGQIMKNGTLEKLGIEVLSSNKHKEAIEAITYMTLGDKISIESDIESDGNENESIKEFSSLLKKNSNYQELATNATEDFLLFGFGGIRHYPKEVKIRENGENKTEWILKSEKVQPINLFGLSLGRIEDDINKSDAIVEYEWTADEGMVNYKIQIITSTKKFTIYNTGVKNEKTGIIDNNFRIHKESLFVLKGQEQDFLNVPYSFIKPKKYFSTLLENYKDIIDAEDELNNKLITDNLNHDDVLIFLKGKFGTGEIPKAELDKFIKDQKGKANKKGSSSMFYSDDSESDMKTFSTPLPTAHAELMKNTLNKEFLKAAGIPDLYGDRTNANYNAIKMEFIPTLAKIKDIRYKLEDFIVDTMQVASIFYEVTNGKKGIYENSHKVNIKFDDSYMINQFDEINALSTAVGANILSKKTASIRNPYSANGEYSLIEKEVEENMETMQENSQENVFNGNREGGSTPGDLRQSSQNKERNNDNQ